ncbi:mitochondrial carrier domain-containing protein [Lipomyces arxii]|uniref:mitochondrial carrier domain-containing protein n=1 Tax=Lipomyces arxii TaxID=56418 RepID=UPI0034CD533D
MSSTPLTTASNKQSSVSKSRQIVSGFVSGFSSSILLQPLDLLKTRVQQSSTSTLSASWNELLTPSQTVVPDDFLHLVRRLWRGTLPSVLRTSLGSGLYFYTLHSMRSYVHDHDKSLSTLDSATSVRSSVLPKIQGYANFLSGGLARGFVGFIMMPFTVLKVRYESSVAQNATLWQTARLIYSSHGVRGFFYGFGVTFVRDTPYAGIYVFLYELAKDWIPIILLPRNNNDVLDESRLLSPSMSILVNALSSTVAATAAVAATNPFDAVKTRMQLFPTKYGTRMWTAFGRLVREDSGARCLFDGLGLRIVRKGLSSGIAWCVYEEMVRQSQV